MSAFPLPSFEALAFSGGGAALAPISLPGDFADHAMDPRDALIKRMADIVLALIGLILMSIPMLLIVAAIRLTSKGPALFRQQRIGLHGRPFVMLKFRTMRHGTESSDGLSQATRNDPRVTRVGAWLRRSSLDEFP